MREPTKPLPPKTRRCGAGAGCVWEKGWLRSRSRSRLRAEVEVEVEERAPILPLSFYLAIANCCHPA
jgi:hypothetical protein